MPWALGVGTSPLGVPQPAWGACGAGTPGAVLPGTGIPSLLPTSPGGETTPPIAGPVVVKQDLTLARQSPEWWPSA
jgi:hypothetical protein